MSAQDPRVAPRFPPSNGPEVAAAAFVQSPGLIVTMQTVWGRVPRHCERLAPGLFFCHQEGAVAAVPNQIQIITIGDGSYRIQRLNGGGTLELIPKRYLAMAGFSMRDIRLPSGLELTNVLDVPDRDKRGRLFGNLYFAEGVGLVGSWRESAGWIEFAVSFRGLQGSAMPV